MRLRTLMMVGCILGSPTLAVAATPASKIPPAPVFPAGTTSDVVQGVTVADPYRALEDPTDPKVQAWSDAQNARTRAYLDALPGRAAIAARLKTLIQASSPAFSELQVRPLRTLASYSDPAKQQPQLVSLDTAADPKSLKVLLDPMALDPSGHTEIDWFVASQSGAKVAVSLSKNGSEDGTLHIFDAATGKEIEALPGRVQYATAGGALAWAGDDSGFWYTRYPPDSAPADQKFINQNLYYHKLGDDPAHDTRVLSAKDGLPPTAEIFVDSEGGANAVASVQLGDGGQWLHYVLKPDGTAQQIGTYADRVIGGAVIDKAGTIYGVSRLDAPMGKVVSLAAPYTGGLAAARIIVPAQSDAAIIDGNSIGVPLVLAGDHLFVVRIAGGPNAVGIYDLDGSHGEVLKLPDVAAVGEIDAMPDGNVLYDVSTFLEPTYFARWTAKTGAVARTAIAQTSPISFADTEVVRGFATSKDGTKVPYTVIRKKGTKLDGHNPTLLYGYGGYGINETPHFAGSYIRLWLDAGGVYVDTNLRGGGEYGQAWHEQGMLTKKQNVFDDFAAVGADLIAKDYTNHDRLALMGGSNGGLLMGAMITQHPGLARAVVSAVGIYDMVRYELDPNGAFNTSEFGTVKNLDQFKALYAYSPYHHIVPGTKYPAILMLTGANDARVNPLNSRKFAAALQAANAGDNPILLRTSKTSGHGIGSSLDDRIAQSTDMLTFLMDQLDMDSQAAGGK